VIESASIITMRSVHRAAASPSACRSRGLRFGPALFPVSCRLHDRRPALRQAFQIQHPVDQVRLLLKRQRPRRRNRRSQCQSFASPNSSSMSFRQRCDRW
jgi:hypothetical protein